MFSRPQQRRPVRNDDRERITGARQAAEALFTPKPQITEQLISDTPPAEQSARKPRVLAILTPAPVRHEEVAAPVNPERQTTCEIPRSGWYYVHATNCVGYNGYLYVYPSEGGYWYTNNTLFQNVLEPQCSHGNWVAFYVYDTSGAWNEVYTYSYK